MKTPLTIRVSHYLSRYWFAPVDPLVPGSQLHLFICCCVRSNSALCSEGEQCSRGNEQSDEARCDARRRAPLWSNALAIDAREQLGALAVRADRRLRACFDWRHQAIAVSRAGVATQTVSRTSFGQVKRRIAKLGIRAVS